MKRKSGRIFKKRRKRLRSKAKNFLDKEKETEGGDSYASGSF